MMDILYTCPEGPAANRAEWGFDAGKAFKTGFTEGQFIQCPVIPEKFLAHMTPGGINDVDEIMEDG